jgi:uncharacterized lipoprotein YmbA
VTNVRDRGLLLLAFLGLGGALLAGGGCALTSKGEAFTPRIFRPTMETSGLAPGQPATGAKADAPTVRLGRIRGAADLREPIAYRVSEVEMGFYDDRRWGERPEAYVRRALVRALFERDGLGQSIAGGGATLDVELLAFEEIRGENPRARVAIEYALHDERTVIIARTVVVEKPIGGASRAGPADAPAFVKAVSAALAEAIDRVATDIGQSLRSPGVGQR